MKHEEKGTHKAYLLIPVAAVAALAVLVAAVLLSRPGCWDREAGLVFISDTDQPIHTVSVSYGGILGGWSECAQSADNCPLSRGQSYGFEPERYPVTVEVFDASAGRKPMARLTIPEAPPQGERWYVTARTEPDGMSLTVTARDPGRG